MIFSATLCLQFILERSVVVTLSTLRVMLVITLSLLPGCTNATVESTATLTESLHLWLQEASEWPDARLQHEPLQSFYHARGFAPMWVSNSGPLPRADALLQTLKEAEREGLDRNAYPIELMEHRWRASDPSVLARLELQLSNAALNYGRDLQVGHAPPEESHRLWHIPVTDFDGAALLETLAKSDEISRSLAALSPSHMEYRRLRSALAYYRQLALLGGWPTIPSGAILHVGDSRPEVTLLRQRLFIEGDLVLDVQKEEHTFDGTLRLAVERFQVRHGLKADGVVGPSTLEAMNVSVEQRIAQIKLNMERWRWFPRDPGKRYILVNIPGFQLRAYEEGKPVMVMDVIVGKPDRPTPIVSGQLHSVVFHPYWTPTPTIIIKDLIPKQLRNSEFMSKRNIRVYRNDREIDPRTVNWRKVGFNYLPYQLRQDPDPHNPMGRVKFLFHNKFDVYLHDTPERGLFNYTERALSSGCVRVSQPDELATFALAGNGNGWNENAVRKALTAKESQTVTLDTPLPVYFLYFTTWVGSDNRAHFRNDVYQLDDTMPSCPGFQELIAKTVD